MAKEPSAGEFAHAWFLHRRAPGHGAAEHAVLAHDFGDLQLRQAVLQGDDGPVGGEIIFQESDDLGVVLLLGHQENDVVLPGHFLRGVGRDRLGELDGARDAGSLRLPGRDVGLVAVDQVDLAAVLGDECAEDGPQGPGAVNSCSHNAKVPLSRHFCKGTYFAIFFAFFSRALDGTGSPSCCSRYQRTVQSTDSPGCRVV